ncbi:hypothetical protein [Persicitalea jodogahamensis]|uniref:Uncharacterized protein n=1 Tax=Persicitalea jodogahamensis TaxID=402147 RepID=A0A8J3DBD0_9BACT|nr:hypothetical protein [Persicitalea jodogahamensis]GHB72143.1 hypothetical protein GCM10007390_27740 [Persicitalea jodogahamensis]
MNKVFICLLLLLGCGTSAQAQKVRLLIAKKVDFEEMPEKERKNIDQEMKEKMDTFLGFGLRLSVDNVEETVKTAADKEKKKKAVRFQIGFQLHRFIKTDPPDKVFKIGWEFGAVK